MVLGGCDRGPAVAGPQASDAPAAPMPGNAGLHVVAGAPAPGATLPDDILRGLSTDARVLDCSGGVVDGRSAFQADWVVAHPLDLDGDGRDDWLVEGRHRCLSGADGADWWVYAGDAAGARLLSAAGRARVVEVRQAAHGGFSDLRLEAAGHDVWLRYDGRTYSRDVPATD